MRHIYDVRSAEALHCNRDRNRRQAAGCPREAEPMPSSISRSSG